MEKHFSFQSRFVTRSISREDEAMRSPGAVAKRLIRTNQVEEQEDLFDACIERLRFLGKSEEIAEIQKMLFLQGLLPTKDIVPISFSMGNKNEEDEQS